MWNNAFSQNNRPCHGACRESQSRFEKVGGFTLWCSLNERLSSKHARAQTWAQLKYNITPRTTRSYLPSCQCPHFERKRLLSMPALRQKHTKERSVWTLFVSTICGTKNEIESSSAVKETQPVRLRCSVRFRCYRSDLRKEKLIASKRRIGERSTWIGTHFLAENSKVNF